MLHPPGAVVLALCALWVAFSAWLSLGTIGFASASGGRIGVLPVSPPVALLVLGAAAIGVALLRRGAPAWPLSLLGLVALPWLPFGAPAAFLLWSGPIAVVVWVAVGLILARGSNLEFQTPTRYWRNPSVTRVTAPVRAGLLAFLIFTTAAWVVSPRLPSGDEPHYLIITQSLLFDGDLKIDNNHRRRDYRSYYRGELPPHVQRLARGGAMYSVHSPGLSVLMLPGFAIAGYRGAVVFLLVVSAAGSALAWWVAWLATRREDAAWFAWAAVTLPVTAVFHSFSVYPDGPGGVLTLTGVWALLRAEEERRNGSERSAPWFWHGVALAALPWLHSRLAVIAGGLGALILLRLSTTRNPAGKAVAFLAVPAISAICWLGYFVALYGRADPSAPYTAGELGSMVWVPGGLGGLLFDQRFGILPYAPVLACAFAGFVTMLGRPEWRRLSLELLFVLLPYLVAVAHFPMWWGGWSAPARFFVPVLPLMAISAAVFWLAAARRHERALAIAALALTVVATVTVVAIDRGRLAYNLRDTPALWFVWLSRASDLPQALPSWSRDSVTPFFRDIGIWAAAGIGVVVGVRAAGLQGRASRHVVLAWALAVAAMVASTAVWFAHGVEGRSVVPAQLEALRSAATARREFAVDLDRGRGLAPGSVPRHIRIELTRPLTSARLAGREVRPLFEVPWLPPGEYRLTPVADKPKGWVMIGIGRDQFALRTEPISSPPQTFGVRFPVNVRGIVVRGDEDARQTVRGLIVEPIRLDEGGEQSGVAQTAVRYRGATVFFLDERSFPEPDAFWVGGGRSSSLAIQPDDGRSSVQVLMRNGPVANEVMMDVAGARTPLKFGPGEERRLSIPVDAARGAALVHLIVASGFRPDAHETGSRDDRFLGVWMRLE